ncbi:MAG: hypothetical protein ACTHQE_08825, partial [Thermomicrobiales bacterium]
CQPIGVLASLDRAMLRLPSGSGVIFSNVSPGEHRVRVLAADGTILAARTVAVGTEDAVTLNLVIGSQEVGTATATRTTTPGETVAPSAPTSTPADHVTAIPTPTPAGTLAPVSGLPNTGGGPADRSGAEVWLMMAAGLMLAAGVGLRSRRRGPRR